MPRSGERNGVVQKKPVCHATTFGAGEKEVGREGGREGGR
jgi:hypothetical protein